MVRQGIAQGLADKARSPVRISAANCCRRARIGIETQFYQRGCAPSCPVAQAGCGPPVSAKPGPGEARLGSAIIARTRDNRNRHGTGHAAPVLPAVKLGEIVATHQPDETMFRIAPRQLCQCIGSIAGAQIVFDRCWTNSRTLGLPDRRGESRRQGRHPGLGLERVAGRDQPPDFVEPQSFQHEQADPAVPAMRGIERPAQKANAFQGLTCPDPRASHL